MIHACAQHLFNDINIEMDFVNCLLSSDYPPDAGQKVRIIKLNIYLILVILLNILDKLT